MDSNPSGWNRMKPWKMSSSSEWFCVAWDDKVAQSVNCSMLDFEWYLIDFTVVPVSNTRTFCVRVLYSFNQWNVHEMAMWIHHLLTKVQQMKLMMRSRFQVLCLTGEGVTQRPSLNARVWPAQVGVREASYARKAQNHLRASHECKADCWIKPWESKGLLEKFQCCPAPTYQLIVHSMALCLWWTWKFWVRDLHCEVLHKLKEQSELH